MNSTDKYNYKVIAKIRDDLPSEERDRVQALIEDKMRRHKLVCMDDGITYHKITPIKEFSDFGGVTLFYAALQDIPECFSKLEWYSIWEGRKEVAV